VDDIALEPGGPFLKRLSVMMPSSFQ